MSLAISIKGMLEEKLLREAIEQESNKHINRHYEYLHTLHEDIERKIVRLGVSVTKTVKRPEYWEVAPGFHPFKVKTKKRLNTYSYTLASNIQEKSYKPATAIVHSISKESGGTRQLNIFQLPDAAISRVVYKSLLDKNLHRLSAYAFAYREDRNAHDAVSYIHREWKNLDRVYVAEFDFSKFFDNIDHSYIWRAFDRHGILCTEEEKFIVEKFLTSESVPLEHYSTAASERRERGIPQGTSISLFLANLVCVELDRALERLGVGFARYADDTVIWSDSYHKIVEAYETIRNFGTRMGVPLNLDKSEGISLISRNGKGELEAKDYINYLGYRISPEHIAISDKKIRRIKKKISFLIYQNLIQPLNHGTFNSLRLNALDWDYVTTISQLRRYLYGGLTDRLLLSYLRGGVRRINFRGLMSYYPLVNDQKQLSKLDGWIVYTLKQTLRLRKKLWKAHSGLVLPGPTSDWIEHIAELKSWKSPAGSVYDLRIPRFSLINRAMQVSIVTFGLSSVVHPKSLYY